MDLTTKYNTDNWRLSFGVNVHKPKPWRPETVAQCWHQRPQLPSDTNKRGRHFKKQQCNVQEISLSSTWVETPSQIQIRLKGLGMILPEELEEVSVESLFSCLDKLSHVQPGNTHLTNYIYSIYFIFFIYWFHVWPMFFPALLPATHYLPKQAAIFQK